MSYDYNTLSGAALLRADPYSQRIMIKNGEINDSKTLCALLRAYKIEE